MANEKQGSNLSGLIIAIIVLAVIVAGALFFRSNSSPAVEGNDDAEVAKVLKAVSKHIVLPADQEPAVLTVEDPDQLVAEQAFFTGASVGDKLIVFPNKAILYNPTEDILVNVGPVYFDQDAEGTSSVDGQ